MERLQSALGIAAFLAFAWAISENRNKVAWRSVLIGLAVTVALAAALLKIPLMRAAFAAINSAVDAIAAATRAGTSFVFGYIGGGPLPFEPKFPGTEFIFAFQALPLVLVLSALTTLLFYWGILPAIVRAISAGLQKTLGVGGAVGLSTAANILVGMVEAPLFIRPYLKKLSRSELFIVMTGGMAGIAGTVLVLYATMLRGIIPDAAGHLLVASVLAAPVAIVIGLIMVPGARNKQTGARMEPELAASGTMDAIVQGTSVGLALMLNIIAMIIVLIALVHLVNAMLGVLPDIGGAPISLERLLGYLMAPVCWLMGLSLSESFTGGALMGVKTVLNELIAYSQLAKLPADALSERSRTIILYALCGFANFGSLGIMIAGLVTMAPERRAEILSLGPKSIVSGTICTCLIAATVGLLI
jgi:concentrative nucleoside transporter, CNT family